MKEVLGVEKGRHCQWLIAKVIDRTSLESNGGATRPVTVTPEKLDDQPGIKMPTPRVEDRGSSTESNK